MAVKYGWKKQFRLKRILDAKLVGAELEALRAKGDCSPKAVWRHARSRSSALHAGFTWDVSQAAEKYWEEEARYIMQHHLVVEIDDVKLAEPVRSTLYLPTETERGTLIYEHGDWVGVPETMETDEGRARILRLALHELRAFQMKYERLRELAVVMNAIKQVLARFGGKNGKRPRRGKGKRRGPRPSARA